MKLFKFEPGELIDAPNATVYVNLDCVDFLRDEPHDDYPIRRWLVSLNSETSWNVTKAAFDRIHRAMQDT